MWNQGANYNEDELEVVKELEQELFKYNPGFRAMWHDNFEEYFKGTFDEKYWNQAEERRNIELDQMAKKRMLEDFEYVAFQHDMAMTQEMFSRDDLFSLKAKDKFHQNTREKWENDQLYQVAKDWGWKLSKFAIELYEKNNMIPLFRIARNASYVPAKIVFGLPDSDWEEKAESLDELAWDTSWIGYTLALTFLTRSLASLDTLKASNYSEIGLDYDYFKTIGLKIKLELMDRLENLHQSVIRNSLSGSNSRE